MTAPSSARLRTRGDRSHTLAVSRDGRVAFTANEGTATLSRLDLAGRAFVDPGCRVITVADAATRRVVSATRMANAPVTVGDVAPDSRVAFANDMDDRAALVVDLETGRVIAKHRAGRGADGVAWGPSPPR